MTATKRSSTSNKKQSKRSDHHTLLLSSNEQDVRFDGGGLSPNQELQRQYAPTAQSPLVPSHSKPPRLEHTTTCLPIVYGSMAFSLGKKADEHHTHQWTLYVRGPNGEDLSVGIAKVVFQLHPSFPQPVRQLTAPPFEVTERGWGEFEATMRIVWRDPEEKAIVLTHGIKLYPPGSTVTPLSNNSAQSTTEPVIHEFYDEIVFTNPTESFQQQLLRGSMYGVALPKITSAEPLVQEHVRTYSDEQEFLVLLEAQKFLDAELRIVKDRILTADREREELEEAIMKSVAQAKAANEVLGGSGVAETLNNANADDTSNEAAGRKTKAFNFEEPITAKKAKTSNR